MTLGFPKLKLLVHEKWEHVHALHECHRIYIRTEFSLVRGLIPLLMKRRNGDHWSREDRTLLMRDLRALSNLSPYLIPILIPGGMLILPLLAWWLDFRRKRRRPSAIEDHGSQPAVAILENRHSSQ